LEGEFKPEKLWKADPDGTSIVQTGDACAMISDVALAISAIFLVPNCGLIRLASISTP
jgi:hypothetical protein